MNIPDIELIEDTSSFRVEYTYRFTYCDVQYYLQAHETDMGDVAILLYELKDGRWLWTAIPNDEEAMGIVFGFVRSVIERFPKAVKIQFDVDMWK